MHSTVLAVHNDLALLFALALQLDARGVSLIPAHSVHDAQRLLSELRLQPDLLIVNCKLRGVCSFAVDSFNQWPALHVVAVVSEGHPCQTCKHLLAATIGDSSTHSIDRWLKLILAVMHQTQTTTQ